eukprot:scaffold28351_cov52-Phaeocystis_antarctica.AAC.2
MQRLRRSRKVQCVSPNERWWAAASTGLKDDTKQIKHAIEQTTHPAWSAQQDRELLVQRWRGTPLAKLQVSSKKEAACAKRWQRFHDATMINLPEHASSDFVAELSDLMSDQAWWDAVEEKRVDMLDRAKEKAGALPPPTLRLNNRKFTPSSNLAGRDRPVAAEGDRAPAAEGAHATHQT